MNSTTQTEATEDGGFSVVSCPTCAADVGVSLPRSAVIDSVTATRKELGDYDASGIDRPRRHCTSCPAGHDLSILYDW